MPEFHALVPAAGSGSRMGSELPKQYLPLAGQPVIAHALNTLCACPGIAILGPARTFSKTTWPGQDPDLPPF